jgi:SAM-dependent methyltransferase
VSGRVSSVYGKSLARPCVVVHDTDATPSSRRPAHTDSHTLTRVALGSLVARIAADVAAVAPIGARVLEVGGGPGHLSIRQARQHGLEVTGLDLDPAMISRARATADRPGNGDQRRPSFLVGDVASLAFPDQSFDLVVSTLSMHHWANPTAGLAEISRVLRPGGRALIWDLRPGPCLSTPMPPTPSDTPMALRFGWSARRLGAGPGSCPSPSGSSCSTPTAQP